MGHWQALTGPGSGGIHTLSGRFSGAGVSGVGICGLRAACLIMLLVTHGLGSADTCPAIGEARGVNSNRWARPTTAFLLRFMIPPMMRLDNFWSHKVRNKASSSAGQDGLMLLLTGNHPALGCRPRLGYSYVG